MIFSSIVFLVFFLPFLLLFCFCFPRLKNVILPVASILFFSVGGIEYTPLLVFCIAISYLGGIWLQKPSQFRKTKLFLILLFLLAPLGIYKYGGFTITLFNKFSSFFDGNQIDLPTWLTPLGISFFTFQAISYVIDIYRSPQLLQRNFIKLAFYITFFPQLIAGPIVRYKEFKPYLNSKHMNLTQVGIGSRRFLVGLAKKVLIADNLRTFTNAVFEQSDLGLSADIAWLALLTYALQIYFDFSGYSDMAIGMARMFGIRIPENFNFPYISQSVGEFWKRWHITLSNWFKDYVYFPLGGSYKSLGRTLSNILFLYLLVGFWHGASWNWIVWGGIYGFFIVLERTLLKSFLQKLPQLFRHIYALTAIILPFVLTKFSSLHQAANYYQLMFDSGIVNTTKTAHLWLLFTNETLIIMIFGLLASVPLYPGFYWVRRHIPINKITLLRLEKNRKFIRDFTLLTLCLIYLLQGSYTPFFYFQF